MPLAQFQHLARGTSADRTSARKEAMDAINRAIETDRTNASSHAQKGVLLAAAPDGDHTGEALECARRAHELNPHDMQSLIGVAYVEHVVGNPETAIRYLQEALRISPRDPMRLHLHQQLAMASFAARQYANGVAYSRRGLDERA